MALGPQLPFRELVKAYAVEADGAGDLRPLTPQQLAHRPGHCGLARTGLADEAERLAGRDLNRDLGDGVDHGPARPPGAELDRQVFDLEQRRRGRRWAVRRRAGNDNADVGGQRFHRTLPPPEGRDARSADNPRYAAVSAKGWQ